MRQLVSSLVVLGLGGVLLACGPSSGGSGVDAGEDACTAGQTRCDGNTFMTCEGGTFTVSQQCPLMCDGQLGCVECRPGANYCEGDEVHACDASGNQAGLVETCTGGLHCSSGNCVDLCAEAEANRSYLGCEYWAVDLDNAIEVMGAPTFLGCLEGKRRNDLFVCEKSNPGFLEPPLAGLCDVPGNTCPAGSTCKNVPACVLDAQGSPFAIVVSNPQAFTVQVSLETEAGIAQTIAVEAGRVHTIYPQQLGVSDRSTDRSGIARHAYKVSADAPIVAYQFNPLDNEDVFSNDGSLLIPRHAFDDRYFALTWPSLDRRSGPPFSSTHDYNGYVTIVAWQDGTAVEVTPTAAVRGGPNDFAGIPAGETRTFTLDAFEVLNLEAASGGDLTGTLVSALGGATVGVFAGHEATVILQEGSNCCADHLEAMMFPTSTWGTEYAIARSQARRGEADVLRILAQEDGTSVTLSSGSCPLLAAGQFCQVDIMNDTVVSADKPIMVGHYLKSVMTSGGQGTGDPAMALAVPIEQWRESYTFLVPQEYDEQYVSIVTRQGTNLRLDGDDVTDQLGSFGGSFSSGRIAVSPGQHTLLCSGGCSVEVYGYSAMVSYLLPGGLDLRQIVVE
jgi:hypothetical protein